MLEPDTLAAWIVGLAGCAALGAIVLVFVIDRRDR